VSQVLVSLNHRELAHEQLMGEPNSFMRQRDLPRPLRARLRDYFAAKHARNSSEDREGKSWLLLSMSWFFHFACWLSVLLLF
jgi:hypothetical protein